MSGTGLGAIEVEIAGRFGFLRRPSLDSPIAGKGFA